MHKLILELWADNEMTIFMITHDIKESFQLGTRLLVFDKAAARSPGSRRLRRPHHLRPATERPCKAGSAGGGSPSLISEEPGAK